MNAKLWGLLLIVLIALGGASYWLSNASTTPDRVPIAMPDFKKIEEASRKQHNKGQSQPAAGLPKPAALASKAPGRVVVLNTTQGIIEFVLFEKDCPKTTARIAELVQGGYYNGVAFTRVVPNFVIQTAKAKKEVPDMGCELVQGLIHAKGSVGMARTADPNTNSSVFYITLEPSPNLDMQYTNFGRVIRGMDVALKIKVGDVIKSAKLRPATDADKKRLSEVFQIESERRTE